MHANAGDFMADVSPVLVVFGAAGQVGRSLTEITPPPGWSVLALDRSAADITDSERVAAVLAGLSCGVVVNLSAYTQVDKAESDPNTAYVVNRDGARLVAEAAARQGLALIHLSTDFVFPGDGRRPLVECAPTGPLSVYGASKLAGEAAVIEVNPRALVLRTAWVFGPHGNNFVKTILRLGRTRPEVSVVADQTGGPTPAPAIAQTIWKLAERIVDSNDANDFGLFHYVGSDPVSWYGFAAAILAEAEHLGLRVAPLRPISTANYPTPARRPLYSVLDCGKIHRRFGIAQPVWRDALRPTLQAIIEEA
jgi:dTDP-4-dehydrorhamnose reductase